MEPGEGPHPPPPCQSVKTVGAVGPLNHRPPTNTTEPDEGPHPHLLCQSVKSVGAVTPDAHRSHRWNRGRTPHPHLLCQSLKSVGALDSGKSVGDRAAPGRATFSLARSGGGP